MRIAIFHNRYRQPGGEDVMVQFEADLLRRAGHEVRCIIVNNEEVFGSRRLAQLKGAAMTAVQADWNRGAMRSVLSELETFKPDVGHVHNWFPMLSPSVYEAHRIMGVPVAQTLHNYRLFCAPGNCWDGEKVCTECIDGRRSRAVRRGCYRGSSLQSAVWWRVISKGWAAGTFTDLVDAYLAPSTVVRDLHAQAGLPLGKLHLVHNACEDPGRQPIESGEPEAVFVGRLEPEKGVELMLEAWRNVPRTLHVVGQGSLSEKMMREHACNPRVKFHGQLPRERVFEFVSRSSLAVFPSLWHEPFGLGVIEAMACGRPVLTAGPGAPGTLIEHGISGFHLPQTNPSELAQAVSNLFSIPSRLHWMGDQARARFLQHFSPRAHLKQLMAVFESIIASRNRRCA